MTEGGGGGEKQSRYPESKSTMYIHYHLFPAKEGIADELAGAQRDGLLFVGHGYILGSHVSCGLGLNGFLIHTVRLSWPWTLAVGMSLLGV